MKARNNQKKKNKGQLVGGLCFMLIGAACGGLIMLYLEHIKESGAPQSTQIMSFALLLAFMYIALLIQIIVHEAGHLIFGLLTGYKFSSFRIANLMWLKEGDGIHFRRMTIAGTGGQCLMIPPDMKDGKMPVMLYNYGGAILNAFTSVICLGLAFICPIWSVGFVILLFFALVGIAYALINGLPVKMGTINNDGRNAYELSKSTEAARAFWIQMKVNELTSRGIRIKDMPDEWFTVPSDESMQTGIVATIGVFACNRMMDEHRFQEADVLMERLLSQQNGIIGLYRNLLVCDRMYVELITENRPGILDEMRTKDQLKIMKAMKKYPTVLRTEYAYTLLAEQNVEKAATIKKKFEKCAESFPYPSEVQAERELIKIAEDKRSE